MLQLLLLLLAAASSCQALQFNNYFGDGMVLQRDVPNKLWGYGTLNDEEVVVSCLERSGRKSSKAYKPKQVEEDVWEVVTDAQPAWTNCFIEMIGTDLAIGDVLYGDLWICSGQSNMEMQMWAVYNSSEEIAYSSIYEDRIRYATVELQTLTEADDDFNQLMKYPWAPASDSKALQFMSAVCFLTGRSMFDAVDVPMGLVASSWGGTPVEAWNPQETLDSCGVPDHVDEEYPQWTNTALWSGMINPLKRASVKGFLWYQGESNAAYNRDLYSCTFPGMISAWRTEFEQNSFTEAQAPFGFVQIAMWREGIMDNGFPVIRWHESADFGYVPNEKMPRVFMSVPLDTFDPKEGYPGNIHPRNKQLASVRLAYAGLNIAYGLTDYPTNGPFPVSAKTMTSQPGSLRVSFDQEVDYNMNAEVSGFYWCDNPDPNACDDSTNSVENWTEISLESVEIIGESTIQINGLNKETGSLAYLWRETPVLETLGLPIYAKDKFRLPAAPWKMPVQM